MGKSLGDFKTQKGQEPFWKDRIAMKKKEELPAPAERSEEDKGCKPYTTSVRVDIVVRSSDTSFCHVNCPFDMVLSARCTLFNMDRITAPAPQKGFLRLVDCITAGARVLTLLK